MGMLWGRHSVDHVVYIAEFDRILRTGGLDGRLGNDGGLRRHHNCAGDAAGVEGDLATFDALSDCKWWNLEKWQLL